MKRVAILLSEGFTDSGLAVMLDVLNTANVLAPGAFAIDVVSAKGGPLRAASGLTIAPTRSVRVAARADVVMVSGIWVEEPRALDAVLVRPETAALLRAIRAAHARGATIAAACAGVSLLAAAGVLDGARATTTWWLASHFRRSFPRVELDPSACLVAHERIVTAGAVFGVADLALHLVARFLGPAKAQRCSSLLLLDRHPSQAAYMAVHQLTANDDLVRAAERWVRDHIGEPFGIATLAKELGTSPRTLARRLAAAVGLSPIAFVQRLRAETAVHLLQTTGDNIDQISTRVGYADANTLRKLLKRHMSASPKQLRSRVALMTERRPRRERSHPPGPAQPKAG